MRKGLVRFQDHYKRNDRYEGVVYRLGTCIEKQKRMMETNRSVLSDMSDKTDHRDDQRLLE